MAGGAVRALNPAIYTIAYRSFRQRLGALGWGRCSGGESRHLHHRVQELQAEAGGAVRAVNPVIYTIAYRSFRQRLGALFGR
ncbi:Hypp4461 [Branchiostoma lanceolatum]|uniref:Hypp4461 protein n=1 Tax=Branchiostoma lanceolatum TaxID=7740 RepID=A0A8K0ADP9_BRALA|nr:Hypp4461 [Branchiostoma lanceolatum]